VLEVSVEKDLESDLRVAVLEEHRVPKLLLHLFQSPCKIKSGIQNKTTNSWPPKLLNMASEKYEVPPPSAGPLRPETRDAITAAIREDSVANLKPLLHIARSSTRPIYPVKIRQLLRSAVEHNALAVLIHVLENEDAPVSELSSFQISENVSLELLEVLLAHGWNINAQDEEDGKRLLDWMCHNEQMVRWLVDHGARVDNNGEEKVNGNTPRPRPLLETCARVGSLSTFMFLQDCGAKLSRRTLHLTASVGAFIGADPGNLLSAEVRHAAAKEDDEVIESRRNVEDILRYLVSEMKLDVNALDTDVPKGINYSGTPLNYAAKEKRGAGVVRWLLENGADSAIKSLGGDGNPGMDAKGYAEWMGCIRVLEALKAWKEDS
jgi:hypothetical protein